MPGGFLPSGHPGDTQAERGIVPMESDVWLCSPFSTNREQERGGQVGLQGLGGDQECRSDK